MGIALTRRSIFAAILAVAGLCLAGCPEKPGTDAGGGGTTDAGGLPACADGVDNDADALVDFPSDPGCIDGADDDETQPPQCGDSLDNDGDALIDFPSDPGCIGTDDPSELNPECSDEIDNDGDSQIDFPNDPDCIGFTDEREAEDPDCADLADNDGDALTDFPADPGCLDGTDPSESDLPDCGALFVNDLGATGILNGMSSMDDMSYFTGSCGGAGPEAIGYLNVPVPLSLLSVNTFGTTYSTAIYLRSTCDLDTSEVGCSTGGNPHNLDLTGVAAGDYWVFADTTTAGDFGPWTLHVFGIIAPGNTCVVGDPVFRCDSTSGQICSEPIVGSGVFVCNAGQCSDGIDNDADAITDFPLDPGCTAPSDNTEPDPFPLPQCYNGMDDDGDTFTDYPADPGCNATGDDLEIDDCITGVPLNELMPDGTASGITSGVSNFEGTCTTSFTASGPEDVYVFELPYTANVTITTNLPGTTLDTAIYVRTVCASTSSELGCNDAADAGMTGALGSELNFPTMAPGTYFIFVDGMGGASGAYNLQVTGVYASGASCDPASLNFTCNALSGDICQDPGTGFACLPADCSDSIDNDGDTIADFPAEPGCAAPADDDETDLPTAPICSDGIDNDGDALSDYGSDPGCFFAADDTEEDDCSPGFPFTPLPASGIYSGTISGFSGGFAGGCQATFCTSGDEDIFIIDIPGDGTATFSTDVFSTSMDTVLYLRSTCDDAATEIACNDNGPLTFFGSLITQTLSQGTYFLFVDSNCSATGGYTLSVTGTLLPGQPCIIGSTMWTCSGGTTCTDPGTGPVCS